MLLLNSIKKNDRKEHLKTESVIVANLEEKAIQYRDSLCARQLCFR